MCFLGFFILLLEQYLYSNLRIMSLTQCFWAFNSNVGTMLVTRCFWAFNSINYSMPTCLLSCIVVHDIF